MNGLLARSSEPFTIGFQIARLVQQVFWLSDHPRLKPSRPAEAEQWPAIISLVKRVPDYSGGTAPELHGVPGC